MFFFLERIYIDVVAGNFWIKIHFLSLKKTK